MVFLSAGPGREGLEGEIPAGRGEKNGNFFALGDKFQIPRGNPDLIFGLKSFSRGGEREARRGEGFAVKIPGE